MINIILGILTGIAGTTLYFKATANVWYIWVMFMVGAAFIIFSVDVYTGSIKEHEKRAAILGFLMFGIPGTVLMGLSFLFGF